MILTTAADLWTQAPRRRWWQRCVQVAPVRIVLGALFLVPAGGVSGVSHARTGGLRVLLEVVTIALLFLSFACFARAIERRWPRELAPRRAAVEWLAGFGIGISLLGATAGLLVAAGAYHVETGGTALALWRGLVGFLAPSLLEEVLMRALFFKILEESIGSWAALVIQGALFGAMHLGNPQATLVGALAIAVAAGALLGAAYMHTRRLWMAWGLHFGWNWAQGSLFGIAVSGTQVSSSWLVSRPTGAAWLTGGKFGVEASPVAVLLCALAAVVVFRAAIRRGQLVRFREQRARVRLAIRAEPVIPLGTAGGAG